MSTFSTIEEALEELRNGNIVIVVDDEDRENEGDMILAAEKVTVEQVNFLTKYARGLICAPITMERSRELELQPMVQINTCQYGTAFTVSVDYTTGTTTGISAFDRYATIRALADPVDGGLLKLGAGPVGNDKVDLGEILADGPAAGGGGRQAADEGKDAGDCQAYPHEPALRGSEPVHAGRDSGRDRDVHRGRADRERREHHLHGLRSAARDGSLR